LVRHLRAAQWSVVLDIKARPTKGELIEFHLSQKLWERQCTTVAHNKALQLTARWHASQVTLFLQLEC
jgi:hypothetical protein